MIGRFLSAIATVVFWLLRLVAGLAMIFAIANLLLFWNVSGAVQWFVISLIFGVVQFGWGSLTGWLFLRGAND